MTDQPTPTACAWQPIESAPKDGTHFLAYEDTGDMYRAAYHREGYLVSFCGQYVTQTPEPVAWMPVPVSPARCNVCDALLYQCSHADLHASGVVPVGERSPGTSQ